MQRRKRLTARQINNRDMRDLHLAMWATVAAPFVGYLLAPFIF